MKIKLEHTDSKGRAFIDQEGYQNLAEMTFSKVGKSMIIINHTAVDESLRGQGIGRKLLDSIVDYARTQEIKILPLCPYAKSEFQKDESINDVLKN